MQSIKEIPSVSMFDRTRPGAMPCEHSGVFGFDQTFPLAFTYQQGAPPNPRHFSLSRGYRCYRCPSSLISLISNSLGGIGETS
jgi:hypothetical protein